MKHTLRISILCIALFCCKSLQGQWYYSVIPAAPPSFDAFVNTPGVTLGQVLDTLRTLANPNDTVEGGTLDVLAQQRQFWQERVGSNDGSGHNMFKQYYAALRAEILAGRGACGTSGYQGAWEVIGPDNLPTQTVGRVDAVWADPDDSNYILAGTPGGLFKTTDGGANWACITDNAPLAGGIWGVNAIAVNPLNKNTIYLATGNCTTDETGGAGLLESFDGGNNWQQVLVSALYPPTFDDSIEDISHVFISPDSTMLYAFVGSRVFASYLPSLPVSWDEITPPGTSTNCIWADLQFDPSNQNHFFISNGRNQDPDKTYQGIYETTDPWGSSWNNITAAYTATEAGAFITDTNWLYMDISMPVADTLYFIALDAFYYGGLYEYCVSTHHIYQLNDSLPSSLSGSRFELVVSNAGTSNNGGKRNMYFGSIIPYMSYNGGSTFIPIGQYVVGPGSTDITHGDIRSVYLQQATNTLHGTSDRIFLATDGGVSKKLPGVNPSVDTSFSTIDISGKGLTCGTFWSFATSESGGLGIGGMMHDGTASYEPALSHKWANLGASDAWGCVVNTATPAKGYSWEWNTELDTTYTAGGRQMGGISQIPIPLDTDFEDNVGVGTQIEADAYGTIYSVQNSFYRRLPTDAVFHDMHTTWGLPFTNAVYGAYIALNRFNTDFEGYVLYNTTNIAIASNKQLLYYRNPSIPTFVIADTVHLPPGTSYDIYRVNALVTDPGNTENVWACVGGIDENNYSDGTRNRVYYSPDHGADWIDMSSGLPQRIPVTRIVYDETSQMLYCSTDAGIYKYDFSSYVSGDTYTNDSSRYENTSVGWTCFSTGKYAGHDFPNAQVTDLQINHCEGKLYAATFGRSIWSTDLNPPGTVLPLNTVITGSQIWSGPGNKYMNGGIDIQSGGTLLINLADTIHMPKDGVIAVEPGGHLIVSGSEITNTCTQCFWGGVQARGNGSLPQNPASNQGWVTIEGNSTITNAYDGVANYNESLGAGWWGTQGGIIQCLGANFVDNKVCASFVAYDNYYPAGVLHNNSSFFKNCTFLLDNNYKGNTTGDVMENMVNMQGVEGIYFDGDQFLNRDTVAYKDTGEGIHATNTGFYVQEYCPIPTGTGTPPPCIPSRFSGFRNGIDVRDALWAVPVSIDQAQFDSCSVGINVSSFNNVSATRNTFIIGHGGSVQYAGPMSDSNCFENIGILMQNSSQFRIEGNDFEGKPNASLYAWNNYGTIVSESGANTNTIYRNTFDSLTYGAYNIGVNASGLFSGPGLKVLCNTFTNNTTDIYVARDGSTTAVQGIAKIQGTEDYSASFLYIPAGNTFSGSTNNIINTGQFIDYYFTGGVTGSAYPPVVAPASGAGSVGRLHTDGSNSCAPSYGSVTTIPGSITGALDMGALRGLKQSYLTAQALLQDSMSAYNSRIDLGNTPGLVAVIARSTDTAALYATLSGGSPYLSETALKAVAGHAALPYLSMLYLLEQNPDDARDGDFLAYIQNVYSFTPTDMTAIARSSLANTARTAIEGSMEGMQDAMAMEANLIMMALKTASDTNVSVTDTTRAGICTDSTSVFYTLDSTSVYWGLDSVDTWLQNIGSLWTNYDRAWYYNWTGQYSVANRIFTSISGILPAQAADTVAYNSYAQMWDVIYNADINGRSMWQLDSTDVAGLSSSTLDSFVYNTGEMMMDVVRHYHDPEPVYADACHWPCSDCLSLGGKNAPGGGQSPQPIININASNTDYDFEAYPNPTSGVVTFSYNMPTGTGGNMKITVTNIVGEKVWEQTSSSAGKMYWDPVNMAAGVYLYQASDDKGIVSKGKLVVVR